MESNKNKKTHTHTHVCACARTGGKLIDKRTDWWFARGKGWGERDKWVKFF